MYNYYSKYIKYKPKYLLLKGGKLPHSENSSDIEDPKINFLPLTYSNNIITLNNKIIKEGDVSLPVYNLNSNYEYEVISRQSVKPTIVNNYYLFNEEIIIIEDGNIIPFDALFLQNSFNIISKLLELLSWSLSSIIFSNSSNSELIFSKII